MSNWQPVETAPKDGTDIDVWVDASVAVFSCRRPDVKWESGRWVEWNARCDDYQPVEEDWSGTDGVRHWVKVTHWMPTPEPPK